MEKMLGEMMTMLTITSKTSFFVTLRAQFISVRALRVRYRQLIAYAIFGMFGYDLLFARWKVVSSAFEGGGGVSISVQTYP